MMSVAPAQNGASMHIPTETPRVHCLTTPTHARRRAGHPLAGGRLGKQKRRASHLGHTRELLAQEHEHIGGRRQANILTRWSLNDVHILTTAFLRGTTPGSPRRGLAITPNVLLTV